jgi:putative ABC transport system permease protein
MRLSNIVRLYRVRLRSRVAQEAFALSGIAIGVALLFASQVTSTSLSGSVRQITSGIVGPMRYQLAARAPEGFSEGMLAAVERAPGVSAALPVLELRVEISGPSGARTVDLVGADPRVAYLAGPLVRRFSYAPLAGLQALALPTSVAQAIGVSALERVGLQIGSLAPTAYVGTTLSEQNVGPLVDSPIALGPLRYVQKLSDMKGLVTSIFVRVRNGEERQATSALSRLAAAHSLNLRPADFEATLFAQAAGPSNQSTLLFSAISALVGFLFAFNALLLTVPQRRNMVEDLRLDGYTPTMILEILLFDALVLGVLASLVGLGFGELLSVGLFNAKPGYLSLGFPVGSQRIVTWQSVALAFAGGTVAAIVGVLAPLHREVFSPLAGSYRRPLHPRARALALVVLGLACLGLTTLILLSAPQAAVAGIVSLMVALLAFLPVALAGAVAVLTRVRRVAGGVATHLAAIELRSRANRARALAVAATGAVAVFGSVAIQGAHANLQQGLDRLVQELNVNAPLVVIPPGEDNLLATTPFRPVDVSAVRALPGVSAVETLRGGLLDYGNRRVWVIGAPRGAREPIPRSQLQGGELGTAEARIRAQGWAVISQALASEHHLHIGQQFLLPSPHPAYFRVAALITNLGWPPGAIILNAEDFARAWGSANPSAYYVRLGAGAKSASIRSAVQRALGSTSGLAVESSAARERRQRLASRQSLARLTQISWLVLIAAVLAMAVAMGSMIWQRRTQLADLKVDGFTRRELWYSLLLESALLVGTGCTLGAALGIYGQVLLSHALATVTGFPVVFSTDALTALWSFLLVTTVAVGIVAVPVYVAARARPAISLQE